MIEFERVIGDIYRLCVPFENIYTSVFLIKTSMGNVVLDCACDANDVKSFIIPALDRMKSTPDYIIVSHSHSDHAGGLSALASYFSAAQIYTARDGDRAVLPENIKILSLVGHSYDCIGVMDMRTNTLISTDGLQLCGVGRYGTGIWNLNEYKATIKRLRNMNIENIIASHDYVPLGYAAFGSENVKRYLDFCEEYVEKLRSFADNSDGNEKDVSERYNKENPSIPPVSKETFKNLFTK